jgi:mRNA-degrading endonuclease RelE of RelBE toxin-antitoxin system
MARIAQLNLRVRPSPKAKLEKLAKQDPRALSTYVEMLPENHVTEQERRRAKRAFQEPTLMRKG